MLTLALRPCYGTLGRSIDKQLSFHLAVIAEDVTEDRVSAGLAFPGSLVENDPSTQIF